MVRPCVCPTHCPSSSSSSKPDRLRESNRKASVKLAFLVSACRRVEPACSTFVRIALPFRLLGGHMIPPLQPCTQTPKQKATLKNEGRLALIVLAVIQQPNKGDYCSIVFRCPARGDAVEALGPGIVAASAGCRYICAGGLGEGLRPRHVLTCTGHPAASAA